MSRQTTLSFTSQSASLGAPAPAPAASTSPPPTSAQPQLARSSSKRKNCIESGLDELCLMFGNSAESDDSATAAAAESASAAAAPASSVSSAVSASALASPSSSPSAPLSRSTIRAIFNSCEHDLQRAIDALADRTGRHTDKHSNFTFSSGSGNSSSGSTFGGDVKKQRVGRLQLEEQRGDLFSCASSVALAHCVSVDLAMGKGIAVAFKSKFGAVADLKSQKKQIGEVAVLKHNGRFVYYLVRSFIGHASHAEQAPATMSASRSHHWEAAA